VCVLLFPAWSSILTAQQIVSVRFPDFADKAYLLYLWEGTKADTILKSALDSSGKADLVFPARKADFRGVATLDFGKTGALDIVINGEGKFTITGGEAEGKPQFTYQNTAENQFVIDYITQQSLLTGKNNLLGYVTQLYKPYESFSLSAQSEKRNLEQQYAALQDRLHRSPLYAARLCEMFDYINYRGSRFGMTDEEIRAERSGYIQNKLDFGALYTSGQWEKITSDWIFSISGSDSALLAEPRRVLERTADRTVKLNITNRLMQLFAKYGKDNLLPQLGLDSLLMPLIGQKAPPLALFGGNFEPKNALLLFYDSDCGNCQNELRILNEKYRILEDNRIRIISLAADVNKDLFEETAQKIAWKDNYCDFKGFDGENFVNYGVVGTPTFILIDNEGIVRGRYSRISEIMK
jgi:hypothetical protein